MDTHAHHAPEAPERSNPVLWTVGLLAIAGVIIAYFAHFYHVGAAHGRELAPLPPSSAEPKGPGEPDHKALIANKGPDVLDRGAILFGKNCATCHGPEGHTNPSNMNPPPRNFWTDSFKNPKGAGPHGLYTVLTDGFNGRMPGFPNLPPEDRYALAHFVREVLVKPHHPEAYVEADPKDLIDKLPLPGTGSGAAKPPVNLVAVPKEVFPLMRGIAAEHGPEAAAASAWLKRAIDGTDGAVGDALMAIDRRWSGSLSGGVRPAGTEALVALSRAVAAGKTDAARAMLLDPPPGAVVPEIALLSKGDLDALIAQLGKAAPAAAPGAGVH